MLQVTQRTTTSIWQFAGNDFQLENLTIGFLLLLDTEEIPSKKEESESAKTEDDAEKMEH